MQPVNHHQKMQQMLQLAGYEPINKIADSLQGLNVDSVVFDKSIALTKNPMTRRNMEGYLEK